MFFQPLYDLFNKAQGMTNLFAVSAMDKPETLEKIVELNTQNQLYDKGVDAEGTPLDEIGGSYSPATKRYKAQVGQPYDRITLKDTGEFYASEVAQFDYSNGDVVLTADTMKDGKDLRQRWGKKILGLTKESKAVIKPINLENIIKQTRTYLKKRGV